jgi:acetylornithine deacetylase
MSIDQVAALLADLIRIDSVNPGLVPGAAGERAIVDLLRRRLDGAGWRTVVVEARGAANRPSLLAWPVQLPGDRPAIVLTGHLDTVGVEGMPHPFDPVVDGTRMTGRGACDMLGGVAAIVVAAQRAAAAGAPAVLALVADEEDRSLGCEAVLDALERPAAGGDAAGLGAGGTDEGGLGIRPQLCLVAEPTWLRRCTSLRGYAVADVAFSGRASHTSLPHEGVNAVTHLARFVMAVEERAHAVRASGGELLVSVAAGGRAPFSIPDAATATVERRMAPGEREDVLDAEVTEILAAMTTADATVSARHTLRMTRPSWQLDPGGPAAAFAARLEAALSSRGCPVEAPFDAPYWMEAALWEARGIPTLVCGPAGGGLHSVDEWVDLEQVTAFTDALAETIVRWGE